MRILSPYYCPSHMRPGDLEYFKALDPAAIRIYEADAERMRRVMEALPYASYYPRRWEITEERDKPRMQTNPVELGVEHAQYWVKKLDEWTARGVNVPRDRTVVVGINEPRLHPDPHIDRKAAWDAWYKETMKQTDIVCKYTVSFLDKCKEYGLRGSALNLSVGWPANLFDDQPSYWDPFESVHEAIVRGNHVLTLHEYWFRSGPITQWGWHGGRFAHNPWKDVKIVIGECGIENRVDEKRMAAEGLQKGWIGSVSASEYARQLVTYTNSLAQDPRIQAAFVFLTDYFDKQWESLDTAGAHNDIIATLKSGFTGKIALVTPDKLKPITPPDGITPPPVTPEQPAGAIVWPVDGGINKITQYWGANPASYVQFGLKGHNGIDLGVATGTPVKSVAAGEVMYVGIDQDYGNYVRIYHPALNVCTFYAHLQNSVVTFGTKVNAGATIGFSGNTGNSTGPHLHFEVRKMKDRLNYDLSFNTGFGSKGQLDPFTFMKLLG